MDGCGSNRVAPELGSVTVDRAAQRDVGVSLQLGHVGKYEVIARWLPQSQESLSPRDERCCAWSVQSPVFELSVLPWPTRFRLSCDSSSGDSVSEAWASLSVEGIAETAPAAALAVTFRVSLRRDFPFPGCRDAIHAKEIDGLAVSQLLESVVKVHELDDPGGNPWILPHFWRLEEAVGDVAIGLEVLGVAPLPVIRRASVTAFHSTLGSSWHRGRLSVTISGREGSNSAINGLYTQVGENANTWPVLVHEDAAKSLHLEFLPEFRGGCWVVAKRRDDGGDNVDDFVAFNPCSDFGESHWRVAECFGFDTDARVMAVPTSSTEINSVQASLLASGPELCGDICSHDHGVLPVILIGLLPDRQSAIAELCVALKECAGECSDVLLDVALLPAFDTRLLDVDRLPSALFARLVRPRLGSAPYAWHLRTGQARGSIGCALSHALAYRLLLEAAAGVSPCRFPLGGGASPPLAALVLEDDAVLLPDRWRNLGGYLDKARDLDLDILLLGFSADEGHDVRCRELNRGAILHEIVLEPGTSPQTSQAALIAPLGYFYRTFAYLITQRGAERLLQGLFPLGWQLDTEISQMCVRGDVRVGGCLPFLAMHPGHDTVTCADYEIFCRMPADTPYKSTAQEVGTSPPSATANDDNDQGLTAVLERLLGDIRGGCCDSSMVGHELVYIDLKRVGAACEAVSSSSSSSPFFSRRTLPSLKSTEKAHLGSCLVVMCRMQAQLLSHCVSVLSASVQLRDVATVGLPTVG
eukprot:TRINITY_DN34358_c0_g1_i1.p1 TRINITY_DN34358_c0_g1~~TRINITY_DN34358_c0_g1_i1.p1  ORF type:complete len:755 (-),score=95.30 TRINITY_DN34358_c0_g1_i1:38-2302(-)